MTTTYDDLRQRMIDGDSTVTATALDKARRDSEFEALQREADDAASQREADAKHRAAVSELEADVRDATTSGLAELQTAYRQMVDAVTKLEQGLAARQDLRASLDARAKALNAREVMTHLPSLRKAADYIAAGVDEAAGRRHWIGTFGDRSILWATHELHDQAYLDQYRTDSEEYLRKAADRRAADLERAAQQRAEQKAARLEAGRQIDAQRRALGLG